MGTCCSHAPQGRRAEGVGRYRVRAPERARGCELAVGAAAARPHPVGIRANPLARVPSPEEHALVPNPMRVFAGAAWLHCVEPSSRARGLSPLPSGPGLNSLRRRPSNMPGEAAPRRFSRTLGTTPVPPEACDPRPRQHRRICLRSRECAAAGCAVTPKLRHGR